MPGPHLAGRKTSNLRRLPPFSWARSYRGLRSCGLGMLPRGSRLACRVTRSSVCRLVVRFGQPPPLVRFVFVFCDVGTLGFYVDSFLFCKADSPRRLGNDSLSVSYTCSGGRRSSKVPLTTSDRNSRSAATIYKSVMSVAYLNILEHQKPQEIRGNSTRGGSARAEEDNIHQRTGPSPPAAAAPGQQTPSRQSSW